jgi:hypothetical protein
MGLPVGRYTARLTSPLVLATIETPTGTSTGRPLDGNGDGLSGDDHTQSFLVTYRGDANADGTVDSADYLTMKRNFGRTAGTKWADGDFNGDGKVSVADLKALEANFGMVVGIEPSQLLHVAAMDVNDGGHRPWVAESLAFSFTADAVVAPATLVLHNDTTGQDVPVPAGTAMAYTAATRTARWDVSGLALPAGLYTATLRSSMVATPFGWALNAGSGGAGAADYAHAFLVTFRGDANLDGSVDMADYLTVKAHIGATTRPCKRTTARRSTIRSRWPLSACPTRSRPTSSPPPRSARPPLSSPSRPRRR